MYTTYCSIFRAFCLASLFVLSVFLAIFAAVRSCFRFIIFQCNLLLNTRNFLN